MSASRRLSISLAASAVLHGIGIALAWRFAMPPSYTPTVVIPIALVGGGKRGSGTPGAETAPPAEPPPVPVPPAVAPATPPPRPASRPAPRRKPPAPAAVASAPAPSAAPGAGIGAGGSGEGQGGGAGGGSGNGVGSGEARVAYDANPAPAYPLVARRLGMEGVVLLEVLVAPDGRAADVRVTQSSGHAPLDDSALRTVRERWHFIPAQRDGRPVESRVTVPIRFRLTDERG
jgi:protein TonB